MKKSLLFFCFAFIVNALFAQNTVVWSGPNLGNWNTPGNWLGGAVPLATDTVIFSSGNNCNVDINPTIASLRITGTGGQLYTTGSNKTITINNNGAASPVFSVASGADLTLGSAAGTFGVSITTYGATNVTNNAQVAGTIFLGFASSWTTTSGTAVTNVDVTGTIFPLASHTGSLITGSTIATFRFLSGSNLAWARNGGNIPVADYQNGSTINVTGVTNTMVAFNASSNYSGLVIWDCPSQTISGAAAQLLPTASYTMDSIRVVNTNTGTLRITTEPAGYTLGQVEVQGGILEMSAPLIANCTATITSDLKITSGTVYGNATFGGDVGGYAMSLTVSGNLIVTGGVLNLTNRVFAAPPVSAACILYVVGDVLQTNPGVVTATTSFGSQNQIALYGTTAQNLTMSTFSGPMALVTLNSSTAGITLLSNLTIPALPSALVLVTGVLHTTTTNLLTMSAGSSVFGANNDSYVDGPVKKIGNTSFIFPIGKSIGTTKAYVPLEISAPGTVTDEYVAEYKRTSAQAISVNYATGLDHVSGVDHWTLDRTSGTDPINLTLYWTVQSSANGSALYINDISKLQIARFNSGIPQWDTYGVTSTTGGFAAGSITWNGVNTFSPFSLASTDASNPLPINLNYLNGFKQNGNHNLTWKVTCTNNPSATMSLERSADSRNYKGITSVTADAVRCQQPFDYTDNSPLAGMNYYRLKMTDAYGKVTFTNAIALLNKESGFDIVGLSPTLVRSNAVLNVTAAQKTKMDVIVTDIAGKQVQKIAYNLIAGSNQFAVNLSGLSAGTYQITGYTADGTSRTVRFVKQ